MMERLFLECAIRAALVVGSAAIVLHVTRVKAAATKHSVWVGVLGLMLLLPIWTAWGPKFPLRLLPPLPQLIGNNATGAMSTLPTAFRPLPVVSTWQVVLLAIYLAGLCFLLSRFIIGTVYARKLVRTAVREGEVRTSSRCAAPVTVGFFRPVVIFPAHWHQWSSSMLKVVMAHEQEHARRRDPLVQWLALLNRALFWFHPAAWWLERNLAALAEEACDDAVLSRGHDLYEYVDTLIDVARSVANSGARLKVSGMAMFGRCLPQRIRQIMKGAQATCISRTRMVCVALACSSTCVAFSTGTLGHAQQDSSPPRIGTAPAARADTRFVLADLKLEGDVHDKDGVRDRVLRAWKGRELDDLRELGGEVLEVGVRQDFMERGYFKVIVNDPFFQVLGSSGGKQNILIKASVIEGAQYRLKTLTIQNIPPSRTTSIPVPTLREQFHIRQGDLFNVAEIRAGLERVLKLYQSRGYADAVPEPVTNIDETSYQIELIVRITEGPHKT